MSTQAYQSVKLVQTLPLEDKLSSSNLNDPNRHEDQLATKTIASKMKCLLYTLAVFIFFCIASTVIIVVYFTIIKDDIKTSQGDTLISTQQGQIQGHRLKAPQNLLVDEFLGIPFAKPPIGKLRYANPEKLDHLPSDPYQADSLQKSCMQLIDTTFSEDFEGSSMWNAPNELSEDCLFLNIWSPANRTTRKLSVMVWIYGGGFFSGSNALWVYDGKALAARGAVVVVSMNYRVGTFGYLATGDGRIKGNFGMMDQVMALRWIQENIGKFGGDVNSVTLFGESSGASSAGLHMMSDISDKLFHRVIFESGSPDSHWAFMSELQARRRSRKFFETVKCPDTNTSSLLKCLRGLSSKDILNSEWVDLRFMVFPWAPTVDGVFLEKPPKQMLQEGRLQQKNSLLGVNRDEGTYWVLYALPGFNKNHESLQNASTFENNLKTLVWDLSPENQMKLKNYYESQIDKTGDKIEKEMYRDATSMLCGDRSFTCPTWNLAEMLSKIANDNVHQYFYYLTKRASVESWPQWMGVIHGAEIQYVFGMPLNNEKKYSQREVRFTEDIIDYWTNFARFGDPNGDLLPLWPRFTAENTQYLVMAEEGFSTRSTLREGYCKVWEQVAP